MSKENEPRTDLAKVVALVSPEIEAYADLRGDA
jgi:hypothetical protein